MNGLIPELQKIDKKIDDLIDFLKKEKSIEHQTIEQVAAKIIRDISDKIDNSNCSNQLLEAIKGISEEKIVTYKQQKPDPPSGESKYKYTYPAFNVGNPELGYTGNPNPIMWPPTEKDAKP